MDNGQVRHQIDSIPDEAIAITALEVVEYLDEDGDRSYAFRYDGDVSVATMLGLLVLLQDDVLRMFGPSREHDEG